MLKAANFKEKYKKILFSKTFCDIWKMLYTKKSDLSLSVFVFYIGTPGRDSGNDFQVTKIALDSVRFCSIFSRFSSVVSDRVDI